MSTNPEAGPSFPRFGAQREQSYSLVLISGLATTALALLGVYILDRNTDDFHIMGWYANYVIPAGAIIVGIVASSGYGLASWFSGIKITSRLLWMVLLLQFIAYFAAQYIEFYNLHLVYTDTGKPVEFLKFFDAEARLFAWKQNNGTMGDPLGAWGYFFRGLEVLGFAGAGLIVPAVLRKAPYCPDCQRYMRTRQLTLVPASVPAKKLKKSDEPGKMAHEAEQQQAFESGKLTLTTLQQFATANQPADFRKKLDELHVGKKQAGKLPGRFGVELVHCQRCYSGRLVAKLLLGQGQNIKQSEFASTDLHSEFVRSVCT